MRRDPKVTKREAAIVAIVLDCKRLLEDPKAGPLNDDDLDVVLCEDGRTIMATVPDGVGGWVSASIMRETSR